jgi:hypothetical protein
MLSREPRSRSYIFFNFLFSESWPARTRNCDLASREKKKENVSDDEHQELAV